jgi:NAD+ diphosphatase
MARQMAADSTQNPFSGASLARRSETREAADWRAAALADPDTRFLLTAGTRHLVSAGSPAAIAFLDAGHPLVRGAGPQQMLLLGWHRDARVVLLEAPLDDGQLPAGTRLEELRPLLPELHGDEGAMLATARALVVWRARHRHCGVCGAPTSQRSAGHALVCTSSECGTQFFPRIDPAVIVLVSDGDHALLGRQASWAPGRYSCLAGFVEAGESLEDAVVREVREESGIQVRAVRYAASQPWPFPSSIMLGFQAEAARGPVELDGELEDARWFSAPELAARGPGMLPPRFTIARLLIEDWYQRVAGQPLPAGP